MTDSIDLTNALAVARQAALAAGDAIAGFELQTVDIELKADSSPVTAADRAAERAIRSVLERHYPGCSIWGEEYGSDQLDAEFLWLIDPIDGTKSWLAGLPFWSIQIALWHQNQSILGVSYAPVLGEMAYSARGMNAYLNEQQVMTSNITTISEMRLSTGNLPGLAGQPKRWQQLGKILQVCNRGRGYGDYYHYHRLAAGQLDAVIESDVNILDVAALQVLVTSAGGVMTDLAGAEMTLVTTSVLAAATPALHKQLQRELNAD